jgi:hypothetical protein
MQPVMSDIPLLTGAGWGLAGAIAMAIMMHARGGDDPPPFAGFWAKFLGDGNPGATMRSMPSSLAPCTRSSSTRWALVSAWH